MKPASQLVGWTFGRLTVKERLPNRSGNTVWRCECICGNPVTATAAQLNRSAIRSCGCLQRERTSEAATTHGKSKTRAYEVWCGMIRRCCNPKRKDYSRYGGRGILVCERWQSFETFHADMGDPPAGMTIERRDNNGNYEPGNCFWASRATQGANTARVIRVISNGRETSLRQACAEQGLSYHTVYMRVRRGATVAEAMR